MSINELAVVVNDNFTVPLNQQIRENRFLPARIIESTQNFIVERSGWYKIICVGAGGRSSGFYSGGSGGVCISTKLLNSGDVIAVSINSGSVTITQYNMTAEAGGGCESDSVGVGGSASGGDENYSGLSGKTDGRYPNSNGAGVGVFIPEITNYNQTQTIQWSSTSSYQAGSVTFSIAPNILGYGHSASSRSSGLNSPSSKSSGGAAACIIIPLEYTE